MKDIGLDRPVLVGRDSARAARRRARDLGSFTIVRFEEKKRELVTAYGTFWYALSRRFA